MRPCCHGRESRSSAWTPLSICSNAPGQDISYPRSSRGTSAPFRSRAGSFDTVVMLTVLEFLERPEAALSETFRVLEPSGQFVIGFLNRRGPWGALRRIRGLLGNAFWRNARFYGRREMAGLLSRAGYTAIKAKGTLFNSFVLLGGYKSPLAPLFQRGEIKSLRLPLRQGPLFQRGALVTLRLAVRL